MRNGRLSLLTRYRRRALRACVLQVIAASSPRRPTFLNLSRWRTRNVEECEELSATKTYRVNSYK
jgi:hypothetical protein